MKYKIYNGELGVKYNKEYTEFKLYAPNAVNVDLIIGQKIYGMEKITEIGLFQQVLPGDFEGKRYQYQVFTEDERYITTDPYAIACEVNSGRGIIIDREKAKIDNFERMVSFENPLDAIIYEISIRDFTQTSVNKGKFLGVIEEKQLNYLKKLGITHVQIMPFYDFSEESVDENNPEVRYNWGYDPVNYNIPEGSFATNPENPYVRIKELKEMIKVLHENGIRVIMDVVYNHVFDAMSHSLWKTMQKDAFRFYENGDFSNGSACGNDIASDNPMVRKYIVDSILYWANEFKLDGFRFDLMGILDVDTMNEIREKLDEIDKGIIVLGEGWDLNTNLDKDKKANQLNAYKMPRIAFFSDDMRDTLRGSTFEKLGKGFANGGKSDDRLINSIKGGINLRGYISPDQLIQYVEAHDNNTVFDHFSITNSEDSLVDRIKMQNIATTLVITSQGIPFLHAGQEFFRTKLGHENSYNLSDEINKFDFNRADNFNDNVEYISNLIEYRKKTSLFKLDSFQEIEEKFKLLKFSDRSLMYSLDNKIFVLVNSSDKAINFEIEKGNYEIIFSSFKKQNSEILIDNLFEVSKYNCVILERK